MSAHPDELPPGWPFDAVEDDLVIEPGAFSNPFAPPEAFSAMSWKGQVLFKAVAMIAAQVVTLMAAWLGGFAHALYPSVNMTRWAIAVTVCLVMAGVTVVVGLWPLGPSIRRVVAGER